VRVAGLKRRVRRLQQSVQPLVCDKAEAAGSKAEIAFAAIDLLCRVTQLLSRKIAKSREAKKKPIASRNRYKWKRDGRRHDQSKQIVT